MNSTPIESMAPSTVDASSTGKATSNSTIRVKRPCAIKRIQRDRTGDPHGSNSNELRTKIDYSEEAIPERDPAFDLVDLSPCDTMTIEIVPIEIRRALARRLEELGMKPERAALVASL